MQRTPKVEQTLGVLICASQTKMFEEAIEKNQRLTSIVFSIN